MLLKEEKSKVIAEYATHEGDTGSPGGSNCNSNKKN